MAVLSNDGIRAGASGGTDAYEIARSLRFSKENQTWLSRTENANPTDAKKWTYSGWIRRGAVDSRVGIIAGTSNQWHNQAGGQFDFEILGGAAV